MDNDQATAGGRRSDPRGGAVVAGKYEVDRLIARGGMAAVYLAHQVGLDRPVALKILSPPPEAEDPDSFEERFRLEASTHGKLDHKHIVTLYDFGEIEDGRFYLAMEYIDGQRLSDLVKDGPLAPERAVHLILQVCSALRYAHKRGVVHRDLKPSNLLIRADEEGRDEVKVVDFGLVKLTETDQSLTRSGLILGSPHCMSPEQIKGLEVDHRTDIYAVGVLLFRTISGQYPFHGANSAATMIKHLNEPVPSFFSVAPDLAVPEGLEEVVRRCLAKNPKDRYQSMGVLIHDLAATLDANPDAYRSVSQANSTISQQNVLPPAPGPGRGLVVGILAAAALLVTTAIALLAVVWVVASSRVVGPTTAAAVTPEPVATVAPPPSEPEVVPPIEADPVAKAEAAAPRPAAAAPVASPTTRPAHPNPKAATPPKAPAKPAPPAQKPAPKPTSQAEEAPAAEGYMDLPDDF